MFFTLAKAHNLFYVVSLPFVALFTAAIYLASSVAAHTQTHTHLQLYTHTAAHTCVWHSQLASGSIICRTNKHMNARVIASPDFV